MIDAPVCPDCGAIMIQSCTTCHETSHLRAELVKQKVRAQKAEVRIQALEGALAGFVQAVDDVERHFNTKDKGGQQVPFHGDFVGAWQLPSVWNQLKWWRDALRAALKEVP